MQIAGRLIKGYRKIAKAVYFGPGSLDSGFFFFLIQLSCSTCFSVCHNAAYKIHFKLHYAALDAAGKSEYNEPGLDSGEFRFGN